LFVGKVCIISRKSKGARVLKKLAVMNKGESTAKIKLYGTNREVFWSLSFAVLKKQKTTLRVLAFLPSSGENTYSVGPTSAGVST
jgi:hypothetical protein